MTDLPRLISLEPSVTEAVPMKEFNDLFIHGLRLNTLENLQQTLTVRLQNYNYDTKDLSPDEGSTQSIFIDNLFTEAERAPLLGYVMGALVTVVGLIYQEQQLSRLIQLAEATGEPTEDLDAQLFSVQQSLGIVA